MIDKKIHIICNGVDYKKRFDSFLNSFDLPLFLNDQNSGTIILDFYNLIYDSHLVKLAFSLTGKNHEQNTSKILRDNFGISLPENISKLLEARRKFSHELVSDHDLRGIKLDNKIYELCDYDKIEYPDKSGLYSGFEDFIITKIEEYYLNCLDDYLDKFIKKLKSDGVFLENENTYFKMVSECINNLLKLKSDHRSKLKKEQENIYKKVGSSIAVEVR